MEKVLNIQKHLRAPCALCHSAKTTDIFAYWGNFPAASMTEVHFSPGEACRDAIIRYLSLARFRADICVFTISDDRISRAIDATHRRGVHVRIITDNEKIADKGSDIGLLAEMRIPVRIDMTENHMHHKFMVVDNALVLTGSYNWTRSAAEKNQENVLITDDKTVVKAFANEFERLWKQMSPLKMV